MTASADRRSLTRGARAAELRRHVRSEVAAAEAREQGDVEPVEADEVEIPWCMPLPPELIDGATKRRRSVSRHLRRSAARTARQSGCLAAYTAGGRPEHEPAECDGSCRRGPSWSLAGDWPGRAAWLLALLVVLTEWRRSRRPVAGCGELHRCECGEHDWHNAPVRSGWRSLLTPEQLAAHDAYFDRQERREVGAWLALVWMPERAADRAEQRRAGLARVSGSAWSRLRVVLEALGVLRKRPDSAAEALAPLAHWLEVCPHTGPPALGTAACWSVFRTAAYGMGAPLIWT